MEVYEVSLVLTVVVQVEADDLEDAEELAEEELGMLSAIPAVVHWDIQGVENVEVV